MYNEIDLTKIEITGEAPQHEPDRQYYFMAKARQIIQARAQKLGHPLVAAVRTFGCPKHDV